MAMSRARHSERPDRHRSVRHLLDDTDEALRKGARPGAVLWPTGFDLLDTTFDGGLRSGELVLLGGTEGSGKTTFAMQVVRNAVAAGRHAVVFSFELTAASLIQRLLGLEAAAAAEVAEDPMTPAADVRSFRAVLESEDPDRRGLGAALGRLPYGRDALTWSRATPTACTSSRPTGRRPITQIAATVACRRRRGRRAADRPRRLPAEGPADADHGIEDETTRVTFVDRDAQGARDGARVPGRRDHRGRPRGPRCRPPDAHP